MPTCTLLALLLALCVAGGDAADLCAWDVKTCPDGSTVSRDPERNCRFPKCPLGGGDDGDLVACTKDLKVCPDGSTVARDPMKNCRFYRCPKGGKDGPLVCTQDVKLCPNGMTYVSRDPNNNCEFEPCPGAATV